MIVPELQDSTNLARRQDDVFVLIIMVFLVVRKGDMRRKCYPFEKVIWGRGRMT